MVVAEHAARVLLQEAGRLDLGEHMRFEIQPDGEHPEIQNDGMQYEGQRFRAECAVAGKVYGRPFGVDVAFGDPILGEPEVSLELVNIPPMRCYRWRKS